jgi:O-antigen ligase
MADRTLGSIVRHNLVSLAILGIMLVFLNKDKTLNLFSAKKIDGIPKKTFIISALLAMSTGIILYNNPGLDLIYAAIILLITLSLASSIYYILSGMPFYAFCLFWIAFPFIYYMQNELRKNALDIAVFDDVHLPLVSLYIIVLFFTSIIANLKGNVLLGNKNLRIIYLLIALAIPPLFFSANPAKSFMFFAVDMLMPICYLVIMVTSIKDEKQIETGIQFLLISFFIFISITLYFYGGKGDKELFLKLYEARTAIIAPVTLACMAAIIFPFSFLFYKKTKNIWYLMLTGLFILLIVMTNFRTAAAGLLIAIIMLYAVSKVSWIKKVFGIVFVVAIVAGLFSLFLRIETKMNIENRIVAKTLSFAEGASIDEMTSGRIEIWASAIRMIEDHPIIGIGAGMWQDNAFLYRSKEYMAYRPGYGHSYYYAMDPHNVFLGMYLKYGLLAFLLFIYLVFYAIRKSYLLHINKTEHSANTMIAGVYISLLVWLFISNFDYSLYDHDLGNILPGILFWTLVGFVFVSMKMSGETSREGGETRDAA